MTRKSEEQKAAEGAVEEIRQEGGPFVVAAQETRMPIVFMDAKVAGNPNQTLRGGNPTTDRGSGSAGGP